MPEKCSIRARQCPVHQCSVNDTRRAVQDKESEKNPFLVTIKADLVHLAIRVFNFINIMMIIFNLDKFSLGQEFSNIEGCWLKSSSECIFCPFLSV